MLRKKNIVLSGGWGYNNLGDDAILMSTLRLLRDLDPNSNIVVFSYSPNDTGLCISNEFENIKCVPCFYRKLFGGEFEKKAYVSKGFKNKLARKIFCKLIDLYANLLLYFLNKTPFLFFEIIKRTHMCNVSLLQNADLYIMSGGGYLNHWKECIISKYIEVSFIKMNNKKIAIWGVTLGPFGMNVNLNNLAAKILSMCDSLIVRDEESVREALLYTGKSVTRIPDLALYNTTKINREKKNVIAFIPYYDLAGKESEIYAALMNVSQLKKCKVIIVISQLWRGPLNMAYSMLANMRTLGVDADLIIPIDYIELENVLSSCSITISQNLHGLILSYRSGTPIISLNATRKFQSFMEQINQINALLPLESLSRDLLEQRISTYYYSEKSSFLDFKDIIFKTIYLEYEKVGNI